MSNQDTKHQEQKFINYWSSAYEEICTHNVISTHEEANTHEEPSTPEEPRYEEKFTKYWSAGEAEGFRLCLLMERVSASLGWLQLKLWRRNLCLGRKNTRVIFWLLDSKHRIRLAERQANILVTPGSGSLKGAL